MGEWITKEAAVEAVRKAWYCEERVKAGFPSAEGFVIAAIRALPTPEPVGDDELVVKWKDDFENDNTDPQDGGTPIDIWWDDMRPRETRRLAKECYERGFRAALSVVREHDRREADAEKLGHSITARTLVAVDDERIALKREADEVRKVLRRVLNAPAHRSDEEPRNIATALHEYDPGGLYAAATRAAKRAAKVKP